MSKVTQPTRAGQRRGLMLHQLLVGLTFSIYAFTAIVALSCFRYSHGCTYVNAAKSQVEMLSGAVDMYVLAIGVCPTTEQGLSALLVAPVELVDRVKWQGPYLDHQQLPVDPWNNTYQYKAQSATEFRIWSNGPDGIAGSKDDITMQF